MALLDPSLLLANKSVRSHARERFTGSLIIQFILQVASLLVHELNHAMPRFLNYFGKFKRLLEPEILNLSIAKGILYLSPFSEGFHFRYLISRK